jgi:hypothetical protein
MCLCIVYQVAACPKRDPLDEIETPLRVRTTFYLFYLLIEFMCRI